MLAIPALLLLLCAYVALPRLYRALLERRLLRLCRRHRLVAFTFDDGPGSQLTPLVLDRLAAAGVPATFFVLGRATIGHEDLVTRMQVDGHEVGSHGEDHVDHLRTAPWRCVRDTARGLDHVQRLLHTGAREIAFRPPHGHLNLVSLVHAWLRRTPIACWTHDGFDTRLWVDVPPALTARALRDSGGGVMLLHDFDRTIPNPTARVLARLDAILALRHEGFRFVRFADLRHVSRGGALPPLPAPAPVAEPARDHEWPAGAPQRRRRSVRAPR